MNRKTFLKYLGFGALTAGMAPSLVFCGPDKKTNRIEPSLSPSADFLPDVELDLIARETEVQVLPGKPTRVFTFTGELRKGDKQQLKPQNGSWLGPEIHLNKGQKVRIYFTNELQQESIIHWHGFHLPPEMDGHPMYAVGKEKTYVYEFTVQDKAGTYWYHPHPNKITGHQVYHGLAGMLIVHDEKEEALGFPSGEFDQSLVIQDRTFNQDNQLVYDRDRRMTRMFGFMGEEILVNGKMDYQIDVAQGGYRLRILNGSNARIYKIAWSDNMPVIVIATDGGFLEKPNPKPYMMLSPGERIEIWRNFKGIPAGKTLSLISKSFEDGTEMGGGPSGGGQMHGRMSPGMSSGNGREFHLMKFNITGRIAHSFELPSTLTQIQRLDPYKADNIGDPRDFYFFNKRMNWVINGRTFDMTGVSDEETVKLGTTEIWRFINGSPGGMSRMMSGRMKIPHPVHIHGLQFNIIQRDTSGMKEYVWNSVKDGFLDEGWQDTFLLMPDMKVQVIMTFARYTGIYMYHCHNLEHEDMGMMRNYKVEYK